MDKKIIMSREEKIKIALDSIEPRENLYQLALEFKCEGMGKEEMYKVFDLFREKCEKENNETEYDAVIDTMDYIVGYCNTGRALFKE